MVNMLRVIPNTGATGFRFKRNDGIAHTAKSGHACVNPTPSASSIFHSAPNTIAIFPNGSTRQQCHVALNMITACPFFLETPKAPHDIRIIAATISTAVQMIFCVP